jgi:Rrf2 family protein
MQMGEGVEWALHTCLNLAWAGQETAVPAAKLAGIFELPPAYLNKQLQALARAGLVVSTSGPRGGFRLARALEDITVMDVVTAIEGPQEAFRCRQILRKGPTGREGVDYREHCAISTTMRRAEMAWRRELASRTLADLRDEVEAAAPGTPGLYRRRLAEL